MEHRKKERKSIEKIEKKEEKEKLQESLQRKRGSQYFERRKTLQLQNPFYMKPFSSPPLYHFKNPFQNYLGKFCTLFGPSFNLAIYMTLVVSFVFTHELHVFSL
jgi:hypothetical protein